MGQQDIGWCAGFLDGEGSFLMAKVGHQKFYGPEFPARKPKITADQIIKAPLEKLKSTLGGSISCVQGRTTSAGNPIYRWFIDGSGKLCEVLPLLIPELTIKKARAELLLELALTFGSGGIKLTPSQCNERITIINKFFELEVI